MDVPRHKVTQKSPLFKPIVSRNRWIITHYSRFCHKKQTELDATTASLGYAPRTHETTFVIRFERMADGDARRIGRMYEAECAVAVDLDHHAYMPYYLRASAPSGEKDKVARTKSVAFHRVALQKLRTRRSVQLKAELPEQIARESGAVKTLGCLAATAVAQAEKFLGMADHVADILRHLIVGRHRAAKCRQLRLPRIYIGQMHRLLFRHKKQTVDLGLLYSGFLPLQRQRHCRNRKNEPENQQRYVSEYPAGHIKV